jgi:hypothetical protein
MQLTPSHVMSALGALIAGAGALAAARGTASLKADETTGSMSMGGPADEKPARIRTAWWQNRMGWWLGAVGVGSIMQAVGSMLP